MANESSGGEIKNAIVHLSELTARIDERVNVLIDNQGSLEETVEGISQSITELTIIANDTKALREEIKESKQEIKDVLEKVNSLTNKVERLEDHHLYHKSRWQTFLDYIVKTIWTILIMYILYKLNIPGNSLVE